jgi:peptide deformylase
MAVETTRMVPETQFDTVRAHFSRIGVRQFGDPVLRDKARPVRLPEEAALATEIIICLEETIGAARTLHEFSRGIGLAAPQIGLRRRVAIAQPLGEAPIHLINPRILETSEETEVSFEGCLSFFDFRGEVRRPTELTVEYQDLHGALQVRELSGDAARLALHEIDHLDGVLYLQRMSDDDRLIEATDELP